MQILFPGLSIKKAVFHCGRTTYCDAYVLYISLSFSSLSLLCFLIVITLWSWPQHTCYGLPLYTLFLNKYTSESNSWGALYSECDPAFKSGRRLNLNAVDRSPLFQNLSSFHYKVSIIESRNQGERKRVEISDNYIQFTNKLQ